LVELSLAVIAKAGQQINEILTLMAFNVEKYLLQRLQFFSDGTIPNIKK